MLVACHVIIHAGGVGHVLVSFPGAEGVRCLIRSCFLIAPQVATRLCPDGQPRVWCDFQQCIPVDEIFRGTAVKSQSAGVGADRAAEKLSLGERCFLLVHDDWHCQLLTAITLELACWRWIFKLSPLALSAVTGFERQ